MIDRTHRLAVIRQAALLGLSRASIYYAPRPVPAGDLAHYRDLLLVAEVVSPASARTDRFLKRRLYQEVGIRLYWVVDGDKHEVEIWTPEVRFPQLERQRLVWHPAGATERFTLELAELFKPI